MNTSKVMRWVLPVVALAVTAGLAVPGVSGAATSSNWSTLGYDTGRSNWNSQETTQTPARVKAATLNFTLSTAVDQCRPGEPVTANGRLFLSDEGRISAHNQWSGRELWTFTGVPDNWFTEGMQVVGDNLVVARTSCYSMTSAGSQIYVLDVATGEPVVTPWGPDEAVRSLAVVGDTVVTTETNDDWSAVRGYDLATGRKLWEANPDRQWYGTVVSGGLVFAHSRVANDFDREVNVAFRVTDGSVVWRRAGDHEVESAAQDGRDLYARSGATWVAMNPRTGRVKKGIRGSGRVGAVNNGAVFAACGASLLCAYSRSDGSLRWTRNVGAGGSSIVVAGGVIYYAGRAFRAYTGSRIRNAFEGERVTAVSGGRIYTWAQTLGSDFELRSYK